MISLFSILVPNYVMDRKRDSASLLFSRDGSQTSKDFQNSGEVMVCRKKKCQSISSKIKAYINIILYLKKLLHFTASTWILFTNLCWLDVSLQ